MQAPRSSIPWRDLVGPYLADLFAGEPLPIPAPFASDKDTEDILRILVRDGHWVTVAQRYRNATHVPWEDAVAAVTPLAQRVYAWKARVPLRRGERAGYGLDALDDVNWWTLEHAYGAATDVPTEIRQLVSPGLDEREQALENLYGSIVHQGSVYPATAAAVPFLLALVEDPHTRLRAEILDMLKAIASAYPSLLAHSHLAPEVARTSVEAQCHAAVRTGLPLFLALVDGASRGPMAATALRLLSHCREDGDRILPRLRALYLRPGPPGGWPYLLAMAYFPTSNPAYTDLCDAVLSTQAHSLGGVVAAITRACLDPLTVPSVAVRILAHAAAWPSREPVALLDVDSMPYQPEIEPTAILPRLSDEAALLAARSLLEALAAMDERQPFLHCATLLATLLFPQNADSTHPTPERAALRRAFLAQLATAPQLRPATEVSSLIVDVADLPLLRVLLPAAFLPGALGEEAGNDLTAGQVTVLGRILDHRVWASRHTAILALSRGLLSAFFDPAVGPSLNSPAGPIARQRALAQPAIARTIAACGYWQRTMSPLPQELGELLAAYGLPPEKAALAMWAQRQ